MYMFPFSSEPATVPAAVCASSTPLTTLTTLTVDRTLNVSWSAHDNVGIRRVAIATVADLSEAGNPITYQTTSGQSHFSVVEPELIRNGNEFFIVVEATDLAGNSLRLDVGPLLVDHTPPSVNGSLTVSTAAGHVIVTWDISTFTDSEDPVPLTDFQFAVGEYTTS